MHEHTHEYPTWWKENLPQGGFLLLYGAFCALWAQNAGRNPWIWFFMGIVLNFVAALAVLDRNSYDRKQRAKAEAGGGATPTG